MILQDYIDLKDLTAIECATRVLQDIHVENSSVINTREFNGVIISLRSWQQQLFKSMMEKIEKEADEDDKT